MKYTLKEPFILNEGYVLKEGFTLAENFILDEQFILNEDEATDAINKYIDAAQKRVNSLLNKLNGLKTNYEDRKQTLTKLDELIDQADLTADPKIAQAKGQEYVNTLKNAIGGSISLNLYPDVKAAFNEVTDITVKATTNKTEAAQLIVSLRRLQKALEQTNSPLATEDSERQLALEALGRVNTTLNTFKQSVDMLTETTKLALAIKNAITDLYKGLPVAADLKKENYRKVIEACNGFLGNVTVKNAVQNINRNAEAAEAEKSKKARADAENKAREESQKADWETLYNKCDTEEDFQNFWLGNENSTDPILKLGYYKAEWGDSANRVRDYGAAFIEELKKAGWDSITNPFIKFLKDRDRVNTFNLDKDHYIVLHNAVANGIVSTKDLFGTGKLGVNNIVFYKKLWDLDADETNTYLELQRRILDNASSLSGAEWAAYSANPAAFVKNILLADGNMTDVTDKAILDNNNSDFRSVTAIKQKLVQLLGNAAEKESITKNVIDERLKAANITIPMAKNMLKYLIDYFTNKYNNTINKFTTKTVPGIMGQLDMYNPTFAEKKQYDEKLKLSATEWNDTLISDLLNKLAIIAKFVEAPKEGA